MRVIRAPKHGVAATSGRHMIMYRAGGAPASDVFEVAIGVIGAGGGARLYKRVVKVTIER